MKKVGQMIASFHQLTGYWLSEDPLDPDIAEATDFLNRMLRHGPQTVAEGHVQVNYDPDNLERAPGYDWVRERLQQLVQSPAVFRDPPFDAEPKFGSLPPVPDNEPFPAFFWNIRSNDDVLLGLREVLGGRDFIVFHQCALGHAGPVDDSDDVVGVLDENGWARPREGSAALFTAEFHQVSHLDLENRGLWTAQLDRFTYVSPWFEFRPEEVKYEICLGLRRPVTGPGVRRFEALVLVGKIEPETEEDVAHPTQMHLASTGFIPKLSALLTSTAKVEWQHAEGSKLCVLEGSLRALRKGLDEFQRKRSASVPAVLSRRQAESLQLKHQTAWEVSDIAEQLSDTCLLNLRQFDEVSAQLLHQDDPWARHTRIELLQINGQLQAASRSLERQSRRLRDEIELALATGRFAGESAPELLLPARSALPWSGPPESFPPLVVTASNPATATEPKGAVWYADPGSDQGGTILVLRPSEFESGDLESLTSYYSKALREASSEELRGLLRYLCGSHGSLCLAGADHGRTQWLRIGDLFAAEGVAGKSSTIRAKFLALSQADDEPMFSAAYRTSSHRELAEGDQQVWLGLEALVAFLDALACFFGSPPGHLQSVADDWPEAHSRFLFVLAILHIVAGRGDEARGCLRHSVHAALERRDLDGAYFVAELFKRYEHDHESEGARPAPETSRSRVRQRQPWRRRAALDFLQAYDLSSAVELARDTYHSGSHAVIRRPKSIRWWLRGSVLGLAVLLLLTDRWIESLSPAALLEPRRRYALIATAALAFLGTPFALMIGARGALARLYPDILYPRILGAITLATITISATHETAKVLMHSSLPILYMLIAVSLGGGVLYLFSQVQRRVGPGLESAWRSLDLFSLAFLEAISVSTVFCLLFGKVFVSKSSSNEDAPFLVDGVFMRPKIIFLVACFTLFVGIVVQLMIQGDSKGTERAPS
jgi:hypothetical protein